MGLANSVQIYFHQSLFGLSVNLTIYRGSYTSGHSFHMEFMKEPSASFIISYEMATSVRFCLSYDPLKRILSRSKMNIISIRKRMVDTDVVNDVTCTHQSVITRVVIRFL